MYALIQDGQIISYGALPDKVYTNGRWYDLRTSDTELIAEAGYVKVVENPRPEDTETVVYDNWDVELVDGVPTMIWRSRTLSQEEIDQRAQMALEQANAEKLQTNTTADLVKLKTAIDELQTLLGDNTVVGSIRKWRGEVTNTYSRDSQRALADLLINQTQANRRVARQVLRLAKNMVGDFESADVGEE